MSKSFFSGDLLIHSRIWGYFHWNMVKTYTNYVARHCILPGILKFYYFTTYLKCYRSVNSDLNGLLLVHVCYVCLMERGGGGSHFLYNLLCSYKPRFGVPVDSDALSRFHTVLGQFCGFNLSNMVKIIHWIADCMKIYQRNWNFTFLELWMKVLYISNFLRNHTFTLFEKFLNLTVFTLFMLFVC